MSAKFVQIQLSKGLRGGAEGGAKEGGEGHIQIRAVRGGDKLSIRRAGRGLGRAGRAAPTCLFSEGIVNSSDQGFKLVFMLLLLFYLFICIFF